MNMKSHRNVDKMSLTSKNSDEQEAMKRKKNRMLLAIQQCRSRYLTEVCELRIMIKVFAYAIPEYLHVPTTYSVMNDMT